MGKANCFRCHQDYASNNQDDLAGDGKCAPCKELSKKIAFKVDIEMAKRRAERMPQVSRIRQLFTEEQIQKGEIAGSSRINIKDLGINPHG